MLSHKALLLLCYPSLLARIMKIRCDYYYKFQSLSFTILGLFKICWQFKHKNVLKNNTLFMSLMKKKNSKTAENA